MASSASASVACGGAGAISSSCSAGPRQLLLALPVLARALVEALLGLNDVGLRLLEPRHSLGHEAALAIAALTWTASHDDHAHEHRVLQRAQVLLRMLSSRAARTRRPVAAAISRSTRR